MEMGNKIRAVAVAVLLAGSVMSVHAQTRDIYSVEYVSSNLKKGVTTRAQVIERFGQPTRKDVKLDSEQGSVETYAYLQGGAAAQSAQTEPARKKRFAGLGNLVRNVGGIANDVAGATGKSYYNSGVYEGAYRAERAANVADRVANAAGPSDSADGQVSATPTAGHAKLLIRMADGVVSGFEMEG